MKTFPVGSSILIVLVALGACSTVSTSDRQPLSQAVASANEAAILALADSIFAAARARDADRFASFFSDQPGFTYLINTRRIGSRDALRTTFGNMLGRQTRFEPRWGKRSVQVISAAAAILTGDFESDAVRTNGERWAVRGVVTFTAVRTHSGWRVINWHTSE